MTKRRAFGSTRKLPSGRWQAGYWHEGRRHTAPMTFPTKTDAAAWLARADADISRGQWIAPGAGKVTLAEVADRWLASNPARPASTSAKYAQTAKAIKAALGDRRVDQITRADAQAAVDGWAVTLAPRSVRHRAAVLHAIYAHAIAAELVVRNSATDLRLPAAALVDRPTLTVDELTRLANILGPDRAPFMWLGAVGGLRWAEVAGLTVADLDLLGGTVSVRHQMQRDGTLGQPKSVAGRRRLAIPRWLIDDLAAHLAARGLTAAHDDALVFVNRAGRPLNYKVWLPWTWRAACVKAGLPTLRFHDLRAMAATALVAAGIDIKTAQARLGHSSPSVTLAIYARATTESDRRAADTIGDVFQPDRARRAHDAPEPVLAKVIDLPVPAQNG